MKSHVTRIMPRMKLVVLLAVTIAMGAGCSSAPQPRGPGGGPEIVEGGVLFRFFDADAKRVNVVGDFNNWSPRADPMVDKNGDGEWTLFYSLGPGSYEYKFVVDGSNWVPDPRNADTAPDGFDGRNSVVRVPGSK